MIEEEEPENMYPMWIFFTTDMGDLGMHGVVKNRVAKNGVGVNLRGLIFVNGVGIVDRAKSKRTDVRIYLCD